MAKCDSSYKEDTKGYGTEECVNVGGWDKGGLGEKMMQELGQTRGTEFR